MINRVATCLSALTLLVVSLSANAATVRLEASSAIVQQGSMFTVDLVMDAADAPGPAPGLINGEPFIEFNSSLASYLGFSPESPVVVWKGPTLSPGNPATVDLSFRNAPKVGLVGQFSFIANDVGILSIGIDDQAMVTSFFNEQSTQVPFIPDFVGTSVEITAIPVPAAAWLMASALGLLGFRARRRSP